MPVIVVGSEAANNARPTLAANIGVVSYRLSNRVSPPRCPEATRAVDAVMKSACVATNPSEYHPGRVLGGAKIVLHSETRPLNVQSLL